MHYRLHYSFSGFEAATLSQMLEENFGVQCRTVSGSKLGRRDLYSVDIEETHPSFDEIYLILSESKSSYNRSLEFGPLIYYPEYTTEEYLSAEWLDLRSSFAKVFPVNQAVLMKHDCVYSVDRRGNPKAMHKRESGSYIVRSAVKWGRNHFASSTTGEGWLCCDDKAQQVIQSYGFRGIDFQPVLKSSTMEPMANIHQLVVDTTVSNKGVIGKSQFENRTCEMCGMNVLVALDTRFRFSLLTEFIPQEVDAFRTPPMFTCLGTKGDCRSKLLISQRMYRAIKDHMLDRNIWVEPIDISCMG